MLAVVTKRKQLVEVLRSACNGLHALCGLTLRVRPFESAATALHDASGAAFLVLDLRACGDHENLEADVTQWKSGNDSGELIVIGSMRDVERQGEIYFYFGRMTTHPFMTAKQSEDLSEWREIILHHPFAILMEDLREQLQDALLTGGEIPNMPEALRMFALSPKFTQVKQLVATDDGTSLKARQNRLPHIFARAGQGPPNELITAFRLLIYTTLKQESHRYKRRWSPAAIAQALNLRNARAVMTTFAERTGHPLRDLELLRPEEVIQIITTVLTPSDIRQPIKVQIAQAVTAAKEEGRVPRHVRSSAVPLVIPARQLFGTRRQ